MRKCHGTEKIVRYRWFSRYVIAAMLVDGKQDCSLARFVCPPAFVHFTIVICVSRDCMKTTYSGVFAGLAVNFLVHLQSFASRIFFH